MDNRNANGALNLHMMDAEECQARAYRAVSEAEKAPDAILRFHWETTARDWAALADTAKLQDMLERRLSDTERI
jgi:hypothetical protein